MKVLLLISAVTLALAMPSGGDSHGGGYGNSDGDMESGGSMEKMLRMLVVQMYSNQNGGSDGNGGGSRDEDSHEQDGPNMRMLQELWEKMQKYQEHRDMHEAMREDSDRDMAEQWRENRMRDQLRSFREYQRAMQEREQREREAARRQEEEMRTLYRKQMMVQQLANLSKQFEHQKFRLIHDVTFQFIDFCKCADTSAMMKKFFTHQFGDLGYMDDWNTAMGGLDMKWSVWDEDEDMDMDDDDDDSGDMMNGQTMMNGTMGGNNTETEDGEGMSEAQRQKWVAKAWKLSRMSQQEISKMLFHNLVKSLCQRAGEFVRYVKEFEMFYARWKAERQEGHD